ncbi:unnamed protein product, partial [Phaeothamnion confervicola]
MDENTAPNAVKTGGSYSVAYPIRDKAVASAISFVAYAKMTVRDYAKHLTSIFNGDRAEVGKEILRRIFNNAATTFGDDLYGDLTVQPLANGDAIKYPPVAGSEVEATANNYLVSNYLASAIDNTNNPYATISDLLESYFGGARTGGSPVVIFISKSQEFVTRGLAGFVAV